MYRHSDAAVACAHEDVARLIAGEPVERDALLDRLCDIAEANSPVVRDYWRATARGRGIPDSAFKTRPPYLFPDSPPVRTFTTSGTTGGGRGRASYSARGMELMRLSILESARRRIVNGLERPAIVRLVPPEAAAPHMVMAYGMELIATTLGDPDLSAVVVGPEGIDHGALATALDRACAEGVPAVLIGGSLAFLNACEELERRGLRWALPPGSRVVDAGGFKGVTRRVAVDDLRSALTRTFGVGGDRLVNLFGMTELASQLYDRCDVPVGPGGERPKGAFPYVQPEVLDVRTLAPVDDGPGLLSVVDLCLVDRPPVVLTGDMALATPHGVAITGRAQRGQSRGCSLTLDRMTAREEPAYA